MYKQISRSCSRKKSHVSYLQLWVQANYVYKSPWKALAIHWKNIFLVAIKALAKYLLTREGKKPEKKSRILFVLFISFSTCIHKSNNCSQDIYIRALKLCAKMLAFLHHFKFEFIFISRFYHFLGSSALENCEFCCCLLFVNIRSRWIKDRMKCLILWDAWKSKEKNWFMNSCELFVNVCARLSV